MSIAPRHDPGKSSIWSDMSTWLAVNSYAPNMPLLAELAPPFKNVGAINVALLTELFLSGVINQIHPRESKQRAQDRPL